METLDAVRLLRSAFPRASFGKESEGAYCVGLEDIDAEELVGAIYTAMRTMSSLPTVADIRKLYFDSRGADTQPDEHHEKTYGPCYRCHRPITLDDFSNPAVEIVFRIKKGGGTDLAHGSCGTDRDIPF